MRNAWAVVVFGVVGCQSPPTEPPVVPPEPAFAPEPQPAHRIAFHGYGSFEETQVYTIRDDGTGLTQLTTTSTVEPVAVWSPAVPNRIAFLMTWEAGGDFWSHPAVIGPNGSGLQDLTPAGVDPAHSLAWSPDGGRLVFVESRNNKARLMVVNADGTGLDTIGGNPKLRGTAWSPDGQRIVYFAGTDLVRTPLINERGVWSVKPDGTGRTKIRNAPGNDMYTGLQFSPDGKKLAMCHKHTNGRTLEVMNANGTGLGSSLLLECDHGQLSGPQWSPDGTRILTVHDSDLYAVALDGSSVAQLTFDGTPVWPIHQGRWSRQGTRIAYVHMVHNRNGTDDRALFIMSANGSSKQRLTPLGMQVYSPSWGP